MTGTVVVIRAEKIRYSITEEVELEQQRQQQSSFYGILS